MRARHALCRILKEVISTPHNSPKKVPLWMAVNEKCCSYGEEISAVALRVLRGPNNAAQPRWFPYPKAAEDLGINCLRVSSRTGDFLFFTECTQQRSVRTGEAKRNQTVLQLQFFRYSGNTVCCLLATAVHSKFLQAESSIKIWLFHFLV